jgi:hypothetical protein
VRARAPVPRGAGRAARCLRAPRACAVRRHDRGFVARYEGEWLDGVAHGTGTYLWEDGRYYQGEWVDGKVKGKGKLTRADGTVLQGYFEPCSAEWYQPMRVPASFWPGQLTEAELIKVDVEAGPARDRAR